LWATNWKKQNKIKTDIIIITVKFVCAEGFKSYCTIHLSEKNFSFDKIWSGSVKNQMKKFLYIAEDKYWSLTLREERRLRVSENRVLRSVFGPKRDEVTGEWRKLHNEELNDLCSLPIIVRVVKLRRMRWAGHVARMREDRGVHRVLVGKPERKRPLGRQRRRWEDNIKMDFQKVVGGRGDWMELAQYRDRWRALVGRVRDFWVP